MRCLALDRNGRWKVAKTPRPGLLEAPAREQHCVRMMGQATARNHARQHIAHSFAVAAVHHAVKVEWPVGRTFPTVGQRDAGIRRPALRRTHRPAHRARRIQSSHWRRNQAHDGARWYRSASVRRSAASPAAWPERARPGSAGLSAHASKGRSISGKPAFEQGSQRPISRGDRLAAPCSRHRHLRCRMTQIETEVDAIGALHAQPQRGKVGGILKRTHRLLDRNRISAGDDEPQVERMLAFIVVVDARMGRHDGRHFMQTVQRARSSLPAAPPRRRRHGEHAADAAQGAVALQRGVRGQHLGHRPAERCRDLREGFALPAESRAAMDSARSTAGR
jgi:hypothetical protein